MAETILIEGPSGSGKSHSLRTLNPKETFIICADRKALPFRGSRAMYLTLMEGNEPRYSKSNYAEINKMVDIKALIDLIATKRSDVKTIIIDTISHAMLASVVRDIMVDNFNKFKIFAKELLDILYQAPSYRKDLLIVFMAHIEEEIVNGTRMRQFKVPSGKFTREAVEVESLFTVVLGCDSKNVEGKNLHFFETQSDGTNKCKSPDGMFPAPQIQNDLQYVIDCYWAYLADKPAPPAKPLTEVTQKQAADSF